VPARGLKETEAAQDGGRSSGHDVSSLGRVI
jgi:hypothetical protein